MGTEFRHAALYNRLQMKGCTPMVSTRIFQAASQSCCVADEGLHPYGFYLSHDERISRKS